MITDTTISIKFLGSTAATEQAYTTLKYGALLRTWSLEPHADKQV